MGILRSYVHVLARQQATHPVNGSVLTLGQQAMYVDLRTVGRILMDEHCPMTDLPGDFDTRSKFNDTNTNARALFTALGAKTVQALDVSGYEDADIISDFGAPINEDLHEKFDFIFDAGTLEHIFNLPIALSNICRMLTVGGHIALFNPCSNAIDHGFYSISPTLYYDFFGANGFSKFSCYLIEGSNVRYGAPCKVYSCSPEVLEYPFSSRHNVVVAFFATKESDVFPTSEPFQSLFSGIWTPRAVSAQKRGAVRKLASFVLRHCPALIERTVHEERRRGRKGIRHLGTW
jgi:SAM-dependent methyltransferase